MISFARLYINNPDLVERFKNNWKLNTNYDPHTWFGFGLTEKGYSDFPKYFDEK